MKTCKYCGRTNENQARFCLECGTDEFKPFISNPSAVVQPPQLKVPPKGPPPSEVKIAMGLLAASLALEAITTIAKLVSSENDEDLVFGIRLAFRLMFFGVIVWLILRGNNIARRLLLILFGVGIVYRNAMIVVGYSMLGSSVFTVSLMLHGALLLPVVILLLRPNVTKWFNRENATTIAAS